MPKLGVNIDHIATVRQARRELEPDPVVAAKLAQQYGADSIVCHLREDRRHINDNDVRRLKKELKKPLTLELSLNPEIVRFCAAIKPNVAMFVPEKRQEITTEGGLDVIKNERKIKWAFKLLKKKNIQVSLFVDPQIKQIVKAKELGSDIVELHTGKYANAKTRKTKQEHLKKLKRAAQYAHKLGLIVNAGHGLKYHDVKAVAKIKEIDELNIGHSIVSQSVFVGIGIAVRQMKRLVK